MTHSFCRSVRLISVMKILQNNDFKFFNSSQVSTENGEKQYPEREYKIVWKNVIILSYLHLAALYGMFLIPSAKLYTNIFVPFLAIFSTIGITAGAHRLWSHKSYKAKLPLRILLGFMCSGTFQNHIYEWCRDHRVHHKYAETDGDPHNAKRGFFFSHVGWLMVKKHSDVIEKGKKIDMSDLEQDGVVMFQKKFYTIIMPLCTFILPTIVPWYFWGESIWISYYVVAMFRYVVAVNIVWCVNSVAHLYGKKPYDKNIGPTESVFLKWGFLGEGYHNYHHTFPWDYKAAELGLYGNNWTCGMIDMFAKIGWAHDLKTATKDMVRKRIARTGDGTIKILDEDIIEGVVNDHPVDADTEEGFVWGWDDVNMCKEDKLAANIHHKQHAL